MSDDRSTRRAAEWLLGQIEDMPISKNEAMRLGRQCGYDPQAVKRALFRLESSGAVERRVVRRPKELCVGNEQPRQVLIHIVGADQ